MPTTAPRSAREHLHWLSVVTHLDPRFGGLSAVVPQLSSEIATREELRVDVAAFCSPGELYATSSFPQLAISEWPAGRRQWFIDRSLMSRFKSMVRQVNGLHLHGLWEQSTQVAAQVARAQGQPYVVSAHDGSSERVLDYEHVARSKLRVDSRKWSMSKASPRKYGESLT